MRRWKWTVFRETASRCSETWRTHRVRAAPWILERHAHHSSTIGRLRSCRTPRIHADFARVDLLARHFLQRVYIDFTIDGISTGRFERWNKHHKCTHVKSSDPTRNSYLAIPSPRSPFTLVTFLFTFRSSTYLLNNSPAPNLIAVRDTCNEIHQFISSDPTIFFFFLFQNTIFFSR